MAFVFLIASIVVLRCNVYNDHEVEIDKYCDVIIECMLHSQSKHISSTAQRLNRKPGWNIIMGTIIHILIRNICTGISIDNQAR